MGAANPAGVSVPPAPVKTAVRTAMPRATPISRSVELAPFAFAWSAGATPASTAFDRGEKTSPIPRPAATYPGSCTP